MKNINWIAWRISAKIIQQYHDSCSITQDIDMVRHCEASTMLTFSLSRMVFLDNNCLVQRTNADTNVYFRKDIVYLYSG